MSEPVGNMPRDPNKIPGNAHREQRVPDPETTSPAPVVEPREPIEKIVTGKVTTVKLPWYKKFGRSLIAEDVTSIREWILTEVIVPSIRNLLADTIKGSTDRVLYGQARVRNRAAPGGVDRPGLRTRYDRMHGEPEPRRMLSRDDRARHDFGAIVLDSNSEAVAVIEHLIDRVERYGVASVADLYDYVGVTGSFADQRYGWTDLRTADVRPHRAGFLLDLPVPQPLR